MTDTKLIVAECRAADLLSCLQAALNGDSHWRARAKKLLWEIDLLVIPEPRIDWLREVDDRKRRAEQMADVALDYAEKEDVS